MNNAESALLWSLGMIVVGMCFAFYISKNADASANTKAIKNKKNGDEEIDWDEEILNDPDAWKRR